MLKKLIIIATIGIAITNSNTYTQKSSSAIKMARVKYSGGGDWYNDPSAEVNLLNYVRQNTNIRTEPLYEYVELATDNLFLYPIIFITGHGNMRFTEAEVINLRTYLENGGFLFIDDDYGLDPYVRKEMKRVFPDKDFVELPFSYGIYHCHYQFPNGLPKTHEHDKKPPQGFGLFHNGRMCVFYAYEANPSDGWADANIHNDPPNKRDEALMFGTNLIVWALSQ